MLAGTSALSTPIVDVSGELTPEMLASAAQPLNIRIDEVTRDRVLACRAFMMQSLAEGQAVYGATTGFGPLVDFSGRVNSADQCENTLSHLSTGQGDDLKPAVVRAALLIRLRSLAQGRSGVSYTVLEALAAMLRTEFSPAVPRIGSVGASGDLVPLAHAVQALRGIGAAYHRGQRMPAGQALAESGLPALELDGRDALGLVNGTSLTAAAAGLALASIRRSHVVAWTLSAVMADVLGCATGYLSPHLMGAFAHPGAAEVAQHMRNLLQGTVPTGDRGLQEPYSIRCVPQLLGAAAASIAHADQVVRTDLNGISDNPLFFPEHGEVVHGGNFFGQPVAFAADLLSLVTVQIANLAERQLDLMVDPHRNGGLPPMLATTPGEQHGVQGVQLVATSTVVHMRRTCTPASMQSVPTNLHNQDVVPFGTQAALSALDQAESLRWLHGSLAVALRQAVHVGRAPTAPACVNLLDRLIEAVPAIEPDRPLRADVLRAAEVLDEFADELENRTQVN
ncbi:aromatic amino acid ammonia-lyase [Saccharopolyspora sp. ASAGF58]|uniref:aromatic amino acid ammonia-lyase n=1 Tax=Saccharopolyspora TaxID=1835 RepID=UPI0014401B21|nr:aromatic amino acid ammonia-lyase [Saccharopolyspora sp. ASAGF58]QIZ34086.1 aromatic amino acid lyase [Saccharopolyspora sp. ASAGF58]